MNLGVAFRRLTFATALWAFLTLCSTGQLHLPVAAGFLVVLIAAWRHPRLGEKLSPKVWTLVSLVALAGALFGWFFLFQRMYSATYLFFYLELNRLLLARTNRDWAQVYALTFFHVLAASVSTEAVFIAPMIAVYMLLVISAMMVFTIKRDAETAFAPAPPAGRGRKGEPAANAPMRVAGADTDRLRQVARYHWLTRRFGWSLTAMTVFVLLGGMGLFWLIPRSANKAFFSPFGPDSNSARMSGFADNVEFGGVGEIQTDPAIVMRAEPLLDVGGRRPAFLRVRGTALDDFSGRNWRKSPAGANQRFESTTDNTVVFRDAELHTSMNPSERTMDFRMTVEPERSGYIFVPDQPVRIVFDRDQTLAVDTALVSAQLIGSRNSQTTYTSRAFLPADQMPGALRSGFEPANEGQGLPAAVGRLGERFVDDARALVERTSGDRSRRDDDLSPVYLSIPNYEGRDVVARTAAEWVAGRNDPADIAEAVENRFKTQFDYSLKSDFSNREDRLAVFLDEAKSGHCEYFATVMALMLRERGIPARIVNGYLTDEWMESAGRFIVRQEHAHSWVEARVDDSGLWRTYDPTPASGIGANRTGQSLYRWWSRSIDAAKLYWYESVIDYNMEDQRSGFRAVLAGLARASEKTQLGLRNMRRWWSGSAEDGESGAKSLIPRMAAGALGLAVLAGLVFLVRLRPGLFARRRRDDDAPVVRDDLKPYIELLLEAERVFPRAPAVTPRAWARTVAAEPSLSGFVPLTDAYYRARFEGVPFDDGLRETIRTLRDQVRERRASTRRTSRSGTVRKPDAAQ